MASMFETLYHSASEKLLSFFDQEKNIPQLLALVINLLLDENCFDTLKIIEILKKYLLSNDRDIHNRALGVAASLSSEKERLIHCNLDNNPDPIFD